MSTGMTREEMICAGLWLAGFVTGLGVGLLLGVAL